LAILSNLLRNLEKPKDFIDKLLIKYQSFVRKLEAEVIKGQMLPLESRSISAVDTIQNESQVVSSTGNSGTD
jgi:chaperone required for assembly of F1-ATPase